MGKNGASAAVTLVERVTRCTAILALPHGRTSTEVVDTVLTHTRVLPEIFAKSLTWDQGVEMAEHARLTAASGMPVYFAHPLLPTGTRHQRTSPQAGGPPPTAASANTYPKAP